jgi:hypothetical protein
MKMEYTKGNQLFTTDITRMSNAVKVIYTRIWPTLLTNGSAESGAWASYNSGTSAQSTVWHADGTYSDLITTTGTTQGARIQTTIAVTAGQSYIIEGRLNVVSGSWRVSANRADNDQSLAFFSTRGGAPGDYTVSMTIPATSTYTGNCDLRITAESGGTTQIYGDSFSFRQTPIPNVNTGWYQSNDSIAVWGRKENVILEPGKTTAAANTEAQTYLSRWGWPQPYPPTNYTAIAAGSETPGSHLRLTFAGYWATLNWLSVPQAIDTGTIANLVTALVGQQSTYITIAQVEANTTDYAIDNRSILLIGDVIKDIAGDGKSGGALYSAGVLTNRQFFYNQVPAELTYHLRGGDLYSVSDSLYEPWLARPGYALWQDLPISPGVPSLFANNDPRWVYIEEIEMLPGGQLTYNLEPQ